MAKDDSVQTKSGRKQALRTIEAKKCSSCGSTKKLERHHLDKDTVNNEKANIKVLCSKCHTALHQKNGDRPTADKVKDHILKLIDAEEYKFKLQGKRKWHDVNISIENKKGSVREGVDPDGKPWSIKMKYAYGRIPRTEGADGDQIDVYMGDDEKSELVFIVHQQDPWKKKYDEDKVFLNFSTKKQVEKAFKGQYDKPGFLGPIDIVSIEVFKDMIKDKSRKGKSIGSSKLTDARIRDAITNLALGILVEMEHTDDIEEAEKIAGDHLGEDDNYYLDPKNPFITEIHEELMALAKESEKVRGGDNEVVGTPQLFTRGDFDKYKQADAGVLTELALTPLIKKLMAKLGFKKMRWIGRGWLVPVGMSEYSKFLTMIPMLKVFDIQLNKFGYHIRINPLGFYIEPVNGA